MMIGSGTSIQRKLSVVVLCAVLLAIAIATAASAWRDAQRFAVAKRTELTGTARVFASAVADDLAANERQEAYRKLRAIAHIPGIQFARVENTDGVRFAEIGAGVMLQPEARGSGLFSAFDIFFQDSVEVTVDVFKSGQVIGRLSLMAESTELRDRLRDSLLNAGIAALIAALFGIAVAWRMQRKITEPIQNLTQAMSEVRESQDFSTQVERQSNDETGTMVDAFNDMLVNIRERDERLAQHRAQLETKVEERTKDLRVAKEDAESANAAKSEFLATMSHEIRTPMNGMLVMAELISGAELAPRQQRYAEVIVKSGQSLLSIINDILDFSKIESGSMEVEKIPLDPATVIDDVLNLFWERASSKGLDLAGYVEADVPALIEGDPVRLNQVLSNLVNNALKFTEKGHVCVIARKLPEAPEGGGITIEFAVQDSGIGIPEDKIDTIFSAFSQADQSTTRKYGGTGLGLAICKRLAHAMGGQIGASSTPGQGSVFAFTIATKSVEDSLQPPPIALRSALIAVDGSVTPATIGGYLKHHGIAVEHVTPAELTPQACQRFDTVFLSPDAVSKTYGGEYPYLVCVSELGDAASDEHLDAGRAHDIIMRPISRTAMSELVARLADGKPLGRDATRRRRNTAAELPSFAGANVLVADDSAVNREVIIEALSRLDVEPDVVEDGQAALNAVKEGSYELVLMDCSMPVMDGFTATRAIRAHENDDEHLPVIALTAHVAGGPVDEWSRSGMDDCVTKPFTLKALAACLEKWLSESEQASAEAPAAPAPEAPVPVQAVEPAEPAPAPVPVPQAPAPRAVEMLPQAPPLPEPLKLETVTMPAAAHQPDHSETPPVPVLAPAPVPAPEPPAAQAPEELSDDELFVPEAAEAAEAPEQETVAAEPEQPVAVGQEEIPVIDQSIIAMLGEMGGEDATGLVERVFGLYETHAPDALQKIDLELNNGDREAVAQAAHALKSMSFNVGARRVGDACSALETTARTDANADLGPYGQTVAIALLEAIDHIKELKMAA